MSDKEYESESSESEIDENDPLAPQLHYIRMQKRLKKVRPDYNFLPWLFNMNTFSNRYFNLATKTPKQMGTIGL